MMKVHEYINGCMNIKVSQYIYDLLSCDSYNYGFRKSDKVNISGFLNELIPRLTEIREEAYSSFLKYNDNDSVITKKVEETIYNVYLKMLDLDEKNNINIPFRISKKSKDKFIYIEDIVLAKYNTDFTNYVRSLLMEYSLKTNIKRELCYYHNDILKLKNAIKNHQIIRIYLSDNDSIEFTPISIEQCYSKDNNYLIGIIYDLKAPYYYELKEIKKISYLDEKSYLTDDMIKNAINYYTSIIIDENPDYLPGI